MTSLPDQAEIHRRCSGGDIEDRLEAASLLKTHFSDLPDKVQAWKDLVNLTLDDKSDVRKSAADALKNSFSQVPDKSSASQDLVSLTRSEDWIVRWGATSALSTAFVLVPNKVQAWQDIHRLIQDENRWVRDESARALMSVFSQVPDNNLAWKDLHVLTHDTDRNVRLTAAKALISVFSHIPDKDQAWKDLIKLYQDEDDYVRRESAKALISVFSQVPDKDQAWKDLIKITKDKYSWVREDSAKALISVFCQVPDKDHAWKDLHSLSLNEDTWSREYAARALISVFSQVPDTDQTWKDLHSLTQESDSYVRMYAYHSLGRASILKATEVEANDKIKLKSELEAAVAYFEKSSQVDWFGPARFCYPFYRTYLAITFHEAKEDEVQRYLLEAKGAVGRSESKDELLKAVENLARALQESQRLKDRSVKEVASELNTYQWYCEKAADYLVTVEKKAPGTVKLMRRCNPFIEERIQFTINEIQAKARQICRITRGSGTEFEAPGAQIHQAATGLSTGELVSIQRSSSSIVKQLKKFCRLLTENEKDQVCRDVDEIEHEADIPEKLHLIDRALFNLEPILKSLRRPLVDVVILTVLPEEYSRVLAKLSGHSQPQHMGSDPNICAWRFGEAFCPNHNGAYKVAVGMIGRAGDIQSALAAKDAISRWRPNYIIFSGIAGGLPDAALRKGDVIIADCIYGYEYGKIEETFKPRGNWTFKTDQGLLTGANAYALQEGWRDHIKAKPPEVCEPKVIHGEIASGEKVIDDPTNEFFKQVLKMWPKVKAVEMEGAGIGSAIEQAQNLKIPVGFMVIRAISDLPRPEENRDGDKTRGTEERDAWKVYASDVAAAFTIGWIADGLPLPPSTGN